eukprot:CAMPEP_0176120396 /NCGR_PEP_ID=MMETSP0120_2-20121206/60561_1 /TAXON_ID=160619 /ORGANISM="Kryptoperidinium foliaceum, Strain CCMP 1326" /LENGTH=144 /DNA_ID=CAMNT_0017454855 /DNA_START=72 /DNA_END=502 /DNA_ORIENTATION=-
MSAVTAVLQVAVCIAVIASDPSSWLRTLSALLVALSLPACGFFGAIWSNSALMLIFAVVSLVLAMIHCLVIAMMFWFEVDLHQQQVDGCKSNCSPLDQQCHIECDSLSAGLTLGFQELIELIVGIVILAAIPSCVLNLCTAWHG